ncbi:MAG: phosphoenolpyruvate carboxylase [Gemmatimonadales bacterium]
MPTEPQHLPAGLTATVGVVEGILGRVIAEREGAGLFEAVEHVRREMVAYRDTERADLREQALARAARSLGALSIEERTAVARAYTLFLQLVNVCENAYRTHRLREHGRSETSARASLTFVLTAHPTESRSPENIAILRRVQDHVVECLESGRALDHRELANLLHLAWRAGTYPSAKPSVEDEATHLASMLTDPILAATIAMTEAGHQVLFRTWVGGDRDGHPGVGPEQTHASLARTRARLLDFVRAASMRVIRADAALVGDREVTRALDRLTDALGAVETVADGDGARVASLIEAVEALREAYRSRVGVDHPAIERIRTLLGIFPGLVVPLELREERGRFGGDEPIADMMRRVAAIARGGPVDSYARAVVVSMTLEAADLIEAQAAARDVLGDSAVPIIPLFELPDVLQRAPDILRSAWEDDTFRAAVSDRGHLEVMLGYSDTAKRMGMLASRVALHDAMREMGRWCESVGITPLFFHGHGGSVGRGGGRIEDLMATWPASARTPYKYTVQGEMVERTFATPEILRSLVQKVAAVQASPPAYGEVTSITRELARASHASFETRVASEDFRKLLHDATPYARLQTLTIGSRPARRAGGGLEGLRAIPWVLCWTQTRLLLHAWLGVGEAWQRIRREPNIEERMARASEEDPLFRSYARLLSFTMAKASPLLWSRYREALAQDAPAELVGELDADFAAAGDLARRALGADSLLPDRPWLEESIRYRAPMIHPLNLLQIDLLAKREWSEAEARLFRETVTGIAAGMLTTG